MSLIPVGYEPVRHPYYVEQLGIHIGSSKELCYLIYNNPLLVMDDFVNDRLIAFIGSELGLRSLARRLSDFQRGGGSPDEMLCMILGDCYYYTEREIGKFRQKIEGYRRLQPSEYIKQTGDYYFSIGRYGTAVRCYEKILRDWRSKNYTEEFMAAVWNNIGASYAGIFWFEKALDAYEMSYSFHKDMEPLKKMYQLTLLNPELRMKKRFLPLLTDERKAGWKKELYDAVSEAEQEPRAREISELFNKDSIRRTSGAEDIISAWKREYRIML